MIVLFRLRGDTAARFSSVNPILARNQVGVETDTRLSKLGDGATAWNDLEYAWGPLSDFLQALSDLTVAPNSLIVTDDVGRPQFLPFGALFSELAAANTAAEARQILGLGTMSTQDADNVSITGGTIAGTNVNGELENHEGRLHALETE